MKRSSFPRQCWTLSGVLIVMALLCVSAASAQIPSIEGTYQHVSRKLPDGTMLSPPDLMGLWTYTKSHRNLNIVLKDATGKFTSRSLVSTYKLTATEYSETLLFTIRTDQIGGKDIVYDLSGETRSVPVTVEGGRIQFQLPFEAPSVVFEGNKITATGSGGVDVWEKVQ